MPNVSQSSLSVLQPVITQLKAVSTALSTFMATNGLAPLSEAVLATNVNDGTTNAAYVAVAQMAALLQIQLTNFRNKQTVLQVQVTGGGNLYDFAAQYYGDPTQAFAIMEANGLCTPWLSYQYVYTLTMPPAQTAAPQYGVTAAQLVPKNTGLV